MSDNKNPQLSESEVSSQEDINNEIEQKYTTWRKDVVKLTIVEKTWLSIDKISLDWLLWDMDNQKNIIDGLLTDRYVENYELDSINYENLRKVLFVSFDEKLNKNELYLQKRENLFNSLFDLQWLYLKRKIEDSNFKKNDKFELFLNDMNKIINFEWNSRINFSESLKTKSLDEKLLIYKKFKWNSTDKKLLIWNIIEENIIKKGFELTYWENWKIIVENNEFLDVSESNEEVKKIINTISSEDLKTFILKDIIKSSWFNNIDANYENIITNLLKKYNIVYKDWSSIVYEDIKTKKDVIVSLISKKLNEDNKNFQEKRDLKFVLDYLNNNTWYTKEAVEQANQFSVLEKAWYNIDTNQWREDLKKAISSWKWFNTFMNDVMSANWGLVWVALVISSIVCLFMWWKYRKTALWWIWLAIGLPALEELAHKYWAWDLAKWNWGKWWLVQNAFEYFQWVDVNIKELPNKFQSKYKLMYKENQKIPNKINNQDFAQIFSQLATNNKVTKKQIWEIKKWLKDWKTVEEILWKWNVPNSFIPWILTSKNEEIIDNRNIPESSVKTFLELLVRSKEDWDVNVSDLFVSWKTKETETYIYRENKFNTELTAIMSVLPLWTELRNNLNEIITKTTNLFSIDTLKSTVSPKSKIEQIKWIIKELESLKSWLNPNEAQVVENIIKLYNKISNKLEAELESEDLINRIKTKAWVRFFWLEWWINNLWNAVIDWIAWTLVYFGLSTSLIPNNLNSVNISDIDWLIIESEDYIKKIDVKPISKEEKDELKKKFQDIILALKEKKWLKLKGDPTQRTQFLAVFWELISANPEKYLKDLESMTSISELKTPFENFWDAAKALIKNFWNIKVLKELVSIEDSSLTWDWKKVKVKARELLRYYEKDYKNNLLTTRKNIEDKLGVIDNNLNNNNLDLNWIIELKKQFDTLYSSNFDNGKISWFLTEHWVKGTQNILETLKKYIWELDSPNLSNLDVAGFEELFNKMKNNLDKKSNELERWFDVSVRLPQSISDNQQIIDYLNNIYEKKSVVDKFSESNKRMKTTQIEAQIAKLKNIFINNIKKQIIFKFDSNHKIIWINQQWMDNVENLKINYDLIKEKFSNWLDNTFNDIYKSKIEEYTYELFSETAWQLTFAQVSDSQAWAILEFKKTYDKYSWLQNHFDSIFKNNLADKKIIDILSEIEKSANFNLWDDRTTPDRENIVRWDNLYADLTKEIKKTKINTMKLLQWSSFEVMTTNVWVQFKLFIQKMNNLI